jgi:outer membrane protein assembly factor BamB
MEKETMKKQLHTRRIALVAVATSALLLSACAADTQPAQTAGAAASAAEPTPRVTLTYDGGILVLDGTTLELEADLELPGFNRVNAAGDGRHVLVSTTDGFQVLDAGTWTVDGESQTAEPELTDLVFDAPTPGHVVRHGEKTILFADGTGETTIFDTDALLTVSDDGLPETEVVPALAAHHGVSIELEDGTLLTTIGTSEGRSGVRVLDASRTETARNEECPSVHGEGAAKNEVAVFGCSDGVLVYDDGEFTKIQAPDAYGRTGNQYVTETSAIAVGDYNSDPDREGVLLEQLTLVDTVAKTAEIVTLPGGAGYTWRDVARGPSDEAIILGSDGALHILDPETGSFDASYPVIGAWEGPTEWQDAHPALVVLGGIAYVTEPATKKIFAVDVETGEVITSAELPATPNEIAVVTG